MDYFKTHFPDKAFSLMTEQTNTLCPSVFFYQTGELPANSRFREWEDTSTSEMQAYVALQIAKGLIQKNEIEDYWEMYPITSSPPSEVMACNRFELLNAFIHFADNSAE